MADRAVEVLTAELEVAVRDQNSAEICSDGRRILDLRVVSGVWEAPIPSREIIKKVLRLLEKGAQVSEVEYRKNIEDRTRDLRRLSEVLPEKKRGLPLSGLLLRFHLALRNLRREIAREVVGNEERGRPELCRIVEHRLDCYKRIAQEFPVLLTDQGLKANWLRIGDALQGTLVTIGEKHQAKAVMRVAAQRRLGVVWTALEDVARGIGAPTLPPMIPVTWHTEPELALETCGAFPRPDFVTGGDFATVSQPKTTITEDGHPLLRSDCEAGTLQFVMEAQESGMTPNPTSNDTDDFTGLDSPRVVSTVIQRLRGMRARLTSESELAESEPNEQLTAAVFHLRQVKQKLAQKELERSTRLVLEGHRLLLGFLLQSGQNQ